MGGGWSGKDKLYFDNVSLIDTDLLQVSSRFPNLLSEVGGQAEADRVAKDHHSPLLLSSVAYSSVVNNALHLCGRSPVRIPVMLETYFQPPNHTDHTDHTVPHTS